MATTRAASRDEGTVEGHVTIRCPVEKVYSFHRDFKNLPSFLGEWPSSESFRPKRSRRTFHRLKELLESGRVTDTSYAVPGKFAS